MHRSSRWIMAAGACAVGPGSAKQDQSKRPAIVLLLNHLLPPTNGSTTLPNRVASWGTAFKPLTYWGHFRFGLKKSFLSMETRHEVLWPQTRLAEQKGLCGLLIQLVTAAASAGVLLPWESYLFPLRFYPGIPK